MHYIEKAICKIDNDKKHGSGFFCKIPYSNNDNNLLKVLLTCEHVLNDNIIFSDKDIKIIVNNEQKIISLKKNRKKWSNKNLDYSCIEILNVDNIDDFFELDDIIFKNKFSNLMYKNCNITVLGLLKNNKNVSSDGIIKRIKNFYFIHNCNTFKGSSGSVIIHKKNNLVLGVHKGRFQFQDNNNTISNIGIFIKTIIDDIYNMAFKMRIIPKLIIY